MTAIRVISVNVGIPREVVWKGQRVATGIYKDPIEGRVRVRTLNLDGDRQADLSVHGGPDKAVYLYPAEHYPYWSDELPGMELPWGMFGENLTTEGLREAGVSIGDRFRVGTTELIVTQPRMPCYKLGIKFGREDMVRRFLESGRLGIYCRVLREGEVGAGDVIEWMDREPHQVSVADIHRLYVADRANQELLERAVRVEALPEGWKGHFRRRLKQL